IQKYISGLGQVSVSGLEPATTYYFEFYNASGVVTAYTTVDTKEYPAKVNYSIKAEGPDSISIQADITSYDGTIPSSFNLCYEILDESGKTLVTGMEKTDTKGLEEWRIEAKADDLEASTTYTVRGWINEPGYTGHFKETARTVTTDKPPFPADTLKVNIVKNNTKSYAADYTITIENYLKAAGGKFKYRMKDSLGEYEVVEISVRKGKTKGTITGLQEGAEYEYEVRISGVVKRGTFKIGTAAIQPELSADTGAYDSVISYQVKRAELKKGTAYSVKLYYYNPETKLYAEAVQAGKMNLTASENYTASVQAADLMMLSPDTQYGFKWELYAGSALSQTIYQLVTTEKSEVSVEITANTADAVNYNIGINGRTENISNDITLFTYICEEGGEYRRYGDSFNLYKSKDYKTENRTLAPLDDGKTYTISFRDIKGGEYGTFTFTFEAKIEGVMMGVTSLTAGAHNFVVQASIEGETDFENQYAVLFFKEKEEEDWDIRSSLLENGQTACGFELTSYLSDDLNADTIYEFVMGISDVAFPKTADGLKGTYSSEVLTQADARSLTNVSANSGYSYISLKAALTNNPINTTSYIYIFYKEADEWEWIKSSESFMISDTTGGILTFIKDLKAGTEYDYIVAVSDSGYNTSLYEIEEDMRQSGSVTTKSADIALAIAADEERSTAGSELLSVEAAGMEGMKSLTAVLTLASENGEQSFAQEVELSKENGYRAEVCFDGLSPETAYTVTGAELKVMETIIGECYAGTVAYLSPQYSFTTKSVQLPESIRISQDQMNLLYDTSVILSAEASPSDASSEVIWSSSNEAVATVDKNGKVHAAAQGEAVITAVSAYSEEVYAQCSVCVKSFVLAEKNADGSLGKSASEWTLYKGDVCDVVLCEVLPDGTLTEVSDYEIVPDKPAIAQISEGVLTGLCVGRTGITLKKDGIEIRINVSVEAVPERFEIVGLSAKDARYPAIKTDEVYELALKDGIRYEMNGALIPSGDFNAEMFSWRSSNTGVLEINDRGVITPVSAGTAAVTVTPSYGMLMEGQEAVFQIHVKPVPGKKTSQIYVDDMGKKIKLEKIAIGDYLGAGWEWKNPKTVMYRLSENAQPYTFETVYTGEGFYACESSVKVYYGNAQNGAETGAKAIEEAEALETAFKTEPAFTGQPVSAEAPKVSAKEITVNTAYNYRDSRGKELSAAQYGSIAIETGDGQHIKSVELTDSDGTGKSAIFEVCDYGVRGYLIRPASEELPQGTYKCGLKITTNASGEPYFYPMKVKVIDKKPKLSAEITKSINLFYTADRGQLSLMPETDGMEIASIQWTDALEDAESGFAIAATAQKAENGVMCYDILQNNIAVSEGTLVDKRVAEGTLTVMLQGVREPYEFDLHIKTCYQKPKLKLTDYNTGAGSSTVSAANGNEAAIKVYDLTQKRMLRYGIGSQYNYDEVRCENDTAVINENKGYYSLRVSYSGSAKLAFVFGAKGWRDTVRAEYTIKSVNPSAAADKDSVVFNIAYSDRAEVNISLKNCAGEAQLSDVEIKGANKKSQQLMENNSVQLIHEGSSVIVSTAGADRTGIYTYKLTPYYTDQASGQKKALNTLTLRVKLIKGTVKADMSAKRSADNQISIETDFSNLGDMHKVKGARLVGEYGRYFTLQRSSYDMSVTNPELILKETHPEMLKRARAYKMAVIYTIETGSGATYEVKSKEFKVRY
ncbi:MAG: Ig-like domain-containing protein, partial [Lachnospiraceae bacterium]|nr:Ig-like domain-containing protein [Lachnospiraceae bacterium]